MITTVKTNGYKVSSKLEDLIGKWKEFLINQLDVAEISIFYYGDKLVFADCYLSDRHYGQFTMNDSCIHYNGCCCNGVQGAIFEKATYNDPLYEGEIF